MNNGNGDKHIIEKPKSMNAVQCPCANVAPQYDSKGKSFTVCVDSQLKDGSAQIKLLVCTSCGAMVEVSEDALVGNKSKIYVDSQGKQHHSLKCEPLSLGYKGKDMG